MGPGWNRRRPRVRPYIWLEWTPTEAWAAVHQGKKTNSEVSEPPKTHLAKILAKKMEIIKKYAA